MAQARKLAAILAADIVGYSRLAGADEDRTLSRLRGRLAGKTAIIVGAGQSAFWTGQRRVYPTNPQGSRTTGLTALATRQSVSILPSRCSKSTALMLRVR
jgi:class 3 adenylate cyclase